MSVKTTLSIKGMRCAGCVSAVEQGLKSVAGVSDAAVNLLTNSATITYDEGKATLQNLISAVKSSGFDAESAAGASPAPAAGQATVQLGGLKKK